MCGIVGFWDLQSSTSGDDGIATVRRMADRLAHRGPDDHGVWGDAHHGLFLAHRRLSIVDLSAAGHQPMVSASERFVIVFNGEIYNHRVLRAELECSGLAPVWRGQSDTEVLLAAFDAWGVEQTLEKAVGMFAFAVWDRHGATLTFSRDRAGEKPLYVGRIGQRIVFTSELKALHGLGATMPEVDGGAIALLLRFGYIPAPTSIYRGIRKLMPGTWLRVSALNPDGVCGTYWSAAQALVEGMHDRVSTPAEDCVDQLERLLTEAVQLQMEADVPVGAFLSGGIDSSTVVALAKKCTGARIKTFSIGFDEEGFDESQHARRVAEHLGTEHVELRVSPTAALAVVPRLASIYDEPFADSSQIPTYLVSKLARESVTVSLSGDGGDELFAGYPRYSRVGAVDRLMRCSPRIVRKFIASGIESVPAKAWTRLSRVAGKGALTSAHRTVGDRLYRVAGILREEPHLLHRYFASSTPNPRSLMPGVQEPATSFDAPERWPRGASLEEIAMWLDFVVYLPDDLLAKVDRAAMAVSLESRVPLLDHRVIEFVHRLPMSMKVRGGQRKWLLRQVLYRHVPQALVDRPKMGFSVPLAAWLRGPLARWSAELLFDSPVSDFGIDSVALKNIHAEHRSGERDWHQTLWAVLMLKAWQASN